MISAMVRSTMPVRRIALTTLLEVLDIAHPEPNQPVGISCDRSATTSARTRYCPVTVRSRVIPNS